MIKKDEALAASSNLAPPRTTQTFHIMQQQQPSLERYRYRLQQSTTTTSGGIKG
jgi:hypothetical protein